jgi:hypothetical protein
MHARLPIGPMAALRGLVLATATAAALTSNALVAPAPVAAAGPKVVVVVGPTNGMTATYIARAKRIAAQARSLGASVTEIYSPHATWSRVAAAAQQAKLFVYLGHGSGYPSPYGFDTAKTDGMGLNPSVNPGPTTPVTYYGEGRISGAIRFAPGAVVLLNHLCYASGSAEPGMAQPSWATARRRVDNYAAGFLEAGAGAVIADAYVDVSYEVRAILTGSSIVAAWRADPNYNGHERSFTSARHPAYRNYLDPTRPASVFYRALTTRPGFAPSAPRPLRGTPRTRIVLRARPTPAAGAIRTLAAGTPVRVTGRLRSDAKGRTWAHVRTAAGQTGYVAAWLVGFRGSARPVAAVVLRADSSLHGRRLGTVPEGRRVTVLGSRRDARLREWLHVRTPSGRSGWIAGWLVRP